MVRSPLQQAELTLLSVGAVLLIPQVLPARKVTRQAAAHLDSICLAEVIPDLGPAQRRSVKRACELLKFFRAAYYAARTEQPSDLDREDAEPPATPRRA